MFNPNHTRMTDKGTRSTNSHTSAEFAEKSSNGRAAGIFSQTLVSSMKWFMDIMVEGLAPEIRNRRRSFDLIVVGKGRTGLTAALYAGRAGINTLLIDRGETGGRSGRLQCTDDCSQVPVRFDMRLLAGTAVIDIRSKAGCLAVITHGGDEYCARVVLLATGTHFPPREGTGGEDSTGIGIHFCSSCGGILNEGQDMVVSEDGDSGPEEPNTDFLRGMIDLDHRGFIKTGKNLETSLKGVFAAGGVRAGYANNGISADDEGATAALMIWDHLEQTGGGKEQRMDHVSPSQRTRHR